MHYARRKKTFKSFSNNFDYLCSAMQRWKCKNHKIRHLKPKKLKSSKGEKYETKVVGNGSSYCAIFFYFDESEN